MAPKRSISPVLLFLGSEHGQKIQALAEVRAALTAAHGEAPEEERHYGFEVDVRRLVDDMYTQSLFAVHRLVIVSAVEQIKAAGDLDALCRYVAAPSTSVTLVLQSDEANVAKRLTDAVAPADVRKFWELFDNQKPTWVNAYIRKAGGRISAEAVEVFLELVQNDTMDLARECDRLLGYYGQGHEIGAEDVEAVLYHSKEESVFTLFNCIAERNVTAAMDILVTLEAAHQRDMGQLVGGLLWQINNLYQLQQSTAAGGSLSKAFGDIRLTGKRRQELYARALKAYSAPEITAMYRTVVDYDYALRSLRPAIHQHLMRMMVYDIVVRPATAMRPMPLATRLFD